MKPYGSNVRGSKVPKRGPARRMLRKKFKAVARREAKAAAQSV